jgi:hypothetical protein
MTSGILFLVHNSDLEFIDCSLFYLFICTDQIDLDLRMYIYMYFLGLIKYLAGDRKHKLLRDSEFSQVLGCRYS